MRFTQQDLLALVAATVGGVVGYFAFMLIASMGFYALVLPGGLLGISAGMFRCRAIAVPIVCGVAALLLGLFTEWNFRPFIADGSFGYFLAHLFDLSPVTLVMIALGCFIGFWAPYRQRMALARPNPRPSVDDYLS